MASLTVAKCFEVLDNGRRRGVLRHLQAQSETGVDDLARHVAACEANLPVDDVPADLVQDVRVMLHHLHLPVLTEADVVRVEDDVVGRGPNFVVVAAYLKFTSASPDPVRIERRE